MGEVKMDLGNKIKNLRKEKKISNTEFSQALGWVVSKVTKIETGKQKLTVEELYDICKVLKVDPASLIAHGSAVRVSNDSVTDADFRGNLFLAAKNYPYTEEEKKNFSGSEVGRIVTKILPLVIEQKANINLNKYVIDGSVGKGQFAEIPWVSVFRKSITETATKGIYIVYLFTADMKGVYLSLNQGFTYFKETYGTKQGREEIKKVARYLQQTCKTIPEDLSLKEIDLKAEKPLGKGYMPGHIAGKYYEIDNLPSSEELADDLRNLMSVYEEIIGLINDRHIEDFYKYVLAIEDGLLLDEEEYHEEIEEYLFNHQGEAPTYHQKPKEKAALITDTSKNEVYPRDKVVAANALMIANYQCEVDRSHPSFVRRKTNTNYTEAHHLVPIENYADFTYSLDVEENLVSLCSNCHNCIHYGIDEQRKPIIKNLFEKRKGMLANVGINITLEQLHALYGIK